MAKIIVEICQNHSGNRAILKELIHAAKENGADIVKGQVIFSEDLTRRERFEEGFIEANGVRKAIKRPYGAEYNRLKGLDLTEEDYRFFVEEAKRIGIVPMLTVFSRKRIPFTASLPWGKERYVKVASYDCGSTPLIQELADHFDHLIISTGATFDGEIEKTAALLTARNKTFSFLHCITSYPNTLAMANLARMKWLQQYAGAVGWSDHTLVARDGLTASKVALMIGAEYIERHFTTLPHDKTKDGPVSINSAQLKELSAFAKLSNEEQRARVEKEIPEWRTLLGSKDRDMTHIEMLNRDYYRGRFASFVRNMRIHNWDDASLS